MELRDYTFLGTTQSLCPACWEEARRDRVGGKALASGAGGQPNISLVPAKIIVRDGRVYFRKHCPVHGAREDFVCSDAQWFDRNQYLTPGKLPAEMAIEPRLGCPFDCGLCTEHEQHTCLEIVEIT